MSSVVPEGWSKLMLGQIGTFSTSSVDKKSKDEETLVSLLNYMDIYRNSVLSSSYPFQSVTAPAKQVTSSSVRNGDVFFTPSSETPDDIGHSAVFIGDAESLVHSYHTIRFRPAANNHFDDNYKAFAFKGEETYEYFRKRATGSTRFTVSLPIFNELEVLCPPLPEQKKIASILTSVDEVIENTQKQIDKLQDLKKATMNELLTKGIGHTEFKDSVLGRIPKSWEVAQIGDVTSFSQGIQVDVEQHHETKDDSKVRFVRISDYTKLDETPRYIDSAFALKGLVEKDDVVMIRYGEAGRVCRGIVGAIANNLFTIRPSPRLLKDYLYHHCASEEIRSKVEALSASSAMPAVSFSSLRTLKLKIPPVDEQDLIVSAISSLDRSIEIHSQKLHQTQSLKKSLMQDLLTGKVRVTVN